MPSGSQGYEKSQPSTGMSTKPQKKVNFYFVTGNPQSEIEKRTVRTIVRSNASNRRWRQVRETQAKFKSQLQIGDGSISGPSNSKALASETSALDEETNGHIQQAKKQRLVARTLRRQSNASGNERLLRSECPREVFNLSQNHFGLMPTSNVSKQSITRMLQGTAASYAQLFPSGRNSAVSQMARDWFQQCLATRGILHTALFCQAMRAQAARPGWSAMPSTELMLCQTEAVHAINDKLLQAATSCDDESVRIVFSLTWHGAVKKDVSPRTPKQSPLADLQSLKMFMGIIACDPFHARGLDHMLRVRDGLSNVEMPGLAFLVSYGDILTSSCNLTRPTWSYGSYARYNKDAAIDDKWLWMTQRADHPLVALGHGFSALRLWLPCERASQLQLVFNNMADYTRASHDFILGPPGDRNRALMADQRNSVQHSLLSLRLAEDETFLERDLFELCWLAGVAYSSIAVFPLAPNAARFDRVAHLLKENLGRPLVLQNWSKATDLVLWITVIGALCAVGTSDRDWLVHLLTQEVERLGISTWRTLKLRILRFLWFPLTSDVDGEELWAEVRRCGRPFVWEQQEADADTTSIH